MIAPGSANPLILAAGGDPLDELGVISRSLRVRSSAGAFFSKALSNNVVNKTTHSFWIKRGSIGAIGGIRHVSIGGTYDETIAVNGDGVIEYYVYAGSSQYYGAKASGLFRDPAAAYHIHIEVDRTLATAADRVKFHVNGVRVPSVVRGTAGDLGFIPQNYVNFGGGGFNYGATETLFSAYGGSTPDGMYSNFAYIHGYTLGPSAFGAFHPATGEWRPKSKAAIRAAVTATGGTRNGWGVNGFFLPFDDPTSATTLGYDRSQSDTDTTGNNWTPTNISTTAGVTYDSMLDTPTNNFPVINPNYASYGAVAGTITDGNLKFTANTTYHFTPCTVPLPEYGKWEAEFIPQDTVSYIGVADLDNGSGSSVNIGAGFGWYGNSLWTGNGTQAQTGLASQAANDKITVAVDMDTRVAKWYQNGVLRITQALTAGKRYAFACGDYYAPGPTSCFANFGQYPITNHIAGYSTLCSKNLRFPAVPKASSAFVAVTDAGANVQATLAAARSGWANYIEIFKRRDVAEGWRWRFSDDLANYLDSSSNAAKAAFPALVAGGSYVGYALKASASNGIATGRLVHTNGVADTVTDGLGNVRKAIILKNEATGDWYLYHPDLTAGKLIYLNGLNPTEFTDGTLGTVLSNSFVVAAALASGTYRWVSIAEVPGVSRVGKWVGNGDAADGAFSTADFSPAFLLHKGAAISSYWGVHDATRDPQNPSSKYLYMGLNSAEYDYTTTLRFDLLSNGVKSRAADNDQNAAGYTYIFIAFAAFPFRYANAR